MTRKNMFSPDELRLFNRCLVGWILSIFILGGLVYQFSIPVNDYSWACWLGQVTPAIDIWTLASKAKHVSMAVWLYMTYSSPLIIAILIWRIKSVYIINPIFTWVVYLIFLSLFTSLFIDGSLFGHEFSMKSDSQKMKIYSETPLGTMLYASILGASFVGIWSISILSVLRKAN